MTPLKSQKTVFLCKQNLYTSVKRPYFKRRKQSKHLFQVICIKTTLSMVFTGGVWQTEGGGVGEKKKKTGGEEKKMGGGGETGMLLEVQSWLLRTLTAYNTSCISI